MPRKLANVCFRGGTQKKFSWISKLKTIFSGYDSPLPRHVLYPRRIYELQAEEGCYSSLPTMSEPPNETLVVLKSNGKVETKKRVQRGRSFKNLMRKITTSNVQLDFNSTEFHGSDRQNESGRRALSFDSC